MHHINRKTVIILGVLVIVVAVCVGLVLAKDYLWPAPVEAVPGDPIDITLDFYDSWLAAALSTTTDPYKENLAKSLILSKELRKKITNAKKNSIIDPVLCNEYPPEKIAARPVSEINGKAEVLIVSRIENQTGQAVVDLIQVGEGWYINDITCSPGEFGPEREFSFDTEGYLLKSVPAPLNSEYWHLVFEERGQPGHFAPLFFSAESTCIALDDTQSTCDPSTFTEPSKAHVRGQMTETGVTVKSLKLLPN